MNYPFILKFSSVRNLSDARYAAGFWADFIGFNFNPDDQAYLEPSKAKEIAGWLSGPHIVGEFAHQPKEWIEDFIKAVPLQAIQIPSTHPSLTLAELGPIKTIVEIKSIEHIPNFEDADIFLCRSLELYKAIKAISNKPLILDACPLDIDTNNIDGVGLTGGNEDKPGTRDQAEWTDFLEKWELA